MADNVAPVTAVWLGRVPYLQAWRLQQSLVQEVRAGRGAETLLLLEHPHVFTMGRRARPEHVLWDQAERARRQVELVWCDRGGDVTYHGPGQLVGYPILDLARHGDDILVFLRTLESSIVAYVASLGLQTQTLPGLTGVWSGGEKVAAIGVKLTERVVSHGFALNLTTDLDYFGGIVPCGLADKTATSVERLGGPVVPVERAARDYAHCFAEAFSTEVDWRPASTLPTPPPDPAAEPPTEALRSLPVIG